MADHYAVPGTTWDGSGLTWAETSGGVAILADPTNSENVFFDANSGAGSFWAQFDTAAPVCAALNFTGFTGELRISDNIGVYGALTLSATMTFHATVGGGFGMNTATANITTNGKTLTVPIFFGLNVTGSWTLQDNVTMTGNSGYINLQQGTLNLNNKDLSITAFIYGNAGTSTLTMGSGTISITGVGTGWGFPTVTNLTLNANTSTIKFTNTSNSAVTFDGGGKTYNNLWFARGASTGSITLTGANTFNDLQDTGTAAHTVIFPNSTTTITTLTDFTGSAGNLISLTRTGGSGTWTISKASGTVTLNYVNISNSTATGGATWEPGANSVNGGGNTGWNFPVSRIPRTTSVGHPFLV